MEHVQRAFCTTRRAAELLGVSLRTAQLWSESGVLEAWKTEGGHRRISLESVKRLLADPKVISQTETIPPPSVRARDDGDRPFSILVVEDEATLCLVYELTLSRWPMQPQVMTAYDGYEALLRVGLNRPDMLVTDLRMPGMNGFQMLRTLRKLHELSDMKIVVVSGLSPDEIEDGGGIPEGIQVLPKPIPFDQLQEIAERVAASRHSPKIKVK